jgi:hypothetical protein
MMRKVPLTAECLERLRVWVQVHCPCALDEPEFMPGLVFILSEEVNEAIERERRRLLEEVRKPSLQ